MGRKADRYEQVRARRLRLIARAEVQRDELAQEVDVWTPALGVLDRGLAGYAWLRAHPEVLLAAGAVLLVLRPRRTVRWSLRLYSVWQAYRRFNARLSRVAAQTPSAPPAPRSAQSRAHPAA